MWGGVDLKFRQGMGLSLIGIACLLGAIFLGLLMVANEARSTGSGSGVALIALALAGGGGFLCLVGGVLVATGPRAPTFPMPPPRA